MCLGIPGQVIELLEGYGGQLALVDVSGVSRKINIGMLDPDEQDLAPGDWVLIHMGFAVERIDAAGAEEALQGLELMGRPRDDPSDPQPPALEVTGPVLFARYAFPPNHTATADRPTRRLPAAALATTGAAGDGPGVRWRLAVPGVDRAWHRTG